MDRRKLAGAAGGLVLVIALVVLLRMESAPAKLERRVDPSIELVAAPAPEKPSNARTSALEPDALRLAWQGSAAAYEVRWKDQALLVTSAEAELTGLAPDDEMQVEIRAVNPVGKRSAPLVVEAVPSAVHKDPGDGQLQAPIDRFDGPESLDPSRWRVLSDPACLGLRDFGTVKRLDLRCTTALQSNRPLRLGVPDDDGVLGRVMLTAAGSNTSSIRLQLLPEPLQDLPLVFVPVQGMVELELTTRGTRLQSDPAIPRTEKFIRPSDSPATGLAPDARHRWEVRVLKDAVVVLRDGAVVAAEAVAVPWQVVHPRIVVERNGMLDSFGVGGAPQPEIPVRVMALRGGAYLGTMSSQLLNDAVSAKVVVGIRPETKNAVTVDYGGTPLSIKVLITEPRVLTADLPLNRGDADIYASDSVLFAQLVLQYKPGARPGSPPRLEDHDPATNQVRPELTTMHESGVKPMAQFPRSGRTLITARVGNVNHEGIELEIDGKKLLTLPTDEDGPGAAGIHEIWIKTADYAPGGHRVKLTVLPDHGEPLTAEAVFEVRETP